MQSLTNAQQQSLVAIIFEECGGDMLFNDFSDALFGMLENVAGFETSTQEEISSLTQQLWSQYHE